MTVIKRKAPLVPAKKTFAQTLLALPERLLTLPFRMVRSHMAMKLLRDKAISVQLIAYDNGRGENSFDCHINHQPWCVGRVDPAKAILAANKRWGHIRHWRK